MCVGRGGGEGSLASQTHFHEKREGSGELCIQAVSHHTVQCGLAPFPAHRGGEERVWFQPFVHTIDTLSYTCDANIDTNCCTLSVDLS